MKDLVKAIKRIREKGNFIFICGNGGSASTAEHFANDLFSKGVKAICLNSNMSIITMIGNDYGYDNIFSKQLDVYGHSNDMLVTISCSGTSPNIVSALKCAKRKGINICNFPSFRQGRDYEKLEDKHLKMAHEIKKML